MTSFMDRIQNPDAPNLPGRADVPPRWVQNPVGVLRQWYPVKTTADKLAGVFQQIADNDGRVELVHHVGGRDYLVCYSLAVLR